MSSSSSSSLYELKDSNRVGRSLFASKSIPFGTLILSDSDILLKFNAEDLSPLTKLLSSSSSSSEEQQQTTNSSKTNNDIAKAFIAEYKSLPALALSAVAIINKTSDLLLLSSEQQQRESSSTMNNSSNTNKLIKHMWKSIKDMHSPPLPISEDSFLLYESCKVLLEKKMNNNNNNNNQNLAAEIAKLWNNSDNNNNTDSLLSSPSNDNNSNSNNNIIVATAVSAILHAVMALKTNAHRCASDNDWCLFPLASKLAHSCDPNCYFIPPSSSNNFTALFVAMKKTIPAGEALSFSYIGGPPLTLSTRQRRIKLQRSHLFVCKCERCEETEDFGNAVVLSGGGGQYVRLSCSLGLPEADFKKNNRNNNRPGLWRKIQESSTTSTSSLASSYLSDSQVEQNANYKDFHQNDDNNNNNSILYNPQHVYAESGKKLKYATIVSSLSSLTSSQCPSLLCFSERRLLLAHPLVVESCRQAVLYFTTMCNLSIRAMNSGLVAQKNKPKVSAFQLLFCWTLKYFSCLDASGIFSKGTTLSKPPHMLVVATTVSLIDLCLQYPKQGEKEDEVILVEDATPATGILAVLAHHCRSLVRATILKQQDAINKGKGSSNNNEEQEIQIRAQEKKLEKFDVLCELETDTFKELEDVDLMSCLEMSCADDSWKRMAFPIQGKTYAAEREFKALIDGWNV